MSIIQEYLDRCVRITRFSPIRLKLKRGVKVKDRKVVQEWLDRVAPIVWQEYQKAILDLVLFGEMPKFVKPKSVKKTGKTK